MWPLFNDVARMTQLPENDICNKQDGRSYAASRWRVTFFHIFYTIFAVVPTDLSHNVGWKLQLSYDEKTNLETEK